MGKILTVVGIVLGGSALFLGSSLMILNMQGRLDGENRKLINQNTLLGSFVSDPEENAGDNASEAGGEGGAQGASSTGGSKTKDLTAEANAAATSTPEVSKERNRKKDPSKGPKKRKSSNPVPAHINAEEGFSAKELAAMFDQAKEARERCDKEWAVIEVEKANLERLREDLSERTAELEKLMSDLATKKSELEAMRQEFREECISIADNEDKMIRKLAELYENMKPPEAAAEQFNSMDIDQAVKIIVRMDSAKSAKIIPSMDADRVMLLMEKLSRFQERKKPAASSR